MSQNVASQAVSRHQARDIALALAAILGSGALFFVGTGAAPIAEVAWLAPLPALLLSPRVNAPTASAVAALGYLLGTTNLWGYYWDSHDVPLPASIAIVLGGSLLFAGAGLLFRALVRRGRLLLAALFAPALWTAGVYLFSLVSPAGLMGTLAWSQADRPVVLQLASVTGVWGVEFLVLFVPSVLAALVAHGVRTSARLRVGIAGALVLAVALGFGSIRLTTAPDNPATHQVALAVHNGAKWAVEAGSPAGTREVAAYSRRIRALPEAVDLVVLPEAVFATNENTLPDVVGPPLAAVARDKNADIVLGLITSSNGTRFNTALAIPAGGGEPAGGYSLSQHPTRTSTGGSTRARR